MDLDVPPDQWARPVGIRRRPDGEGIRSSWLAAVIYVNSERFGRRASCSDDLSSASECSVGVRTTRPAANRKRVNGLGFDPHAGLMQLRQRVVGPLGIAQQRRFGDFDFEAMGG